MTRKAIATIDHAAIRHNFSRVKSFAPNHKVMAMIKARAYGHGLIEVASTLTHADALGVACMSEAVALRQAGITTPIVLASGIHDPSQIELLFEYDITPVIHAPWQVDALEKMQPDKPLYVWLKFDSGMHRLGFDLDALLRSYERLRELTFVSGIGLMSHLAMADQVDAVMNDKQFDEFQRVATMCEWNDLTLANSAAVVSRPDMLAVTNWVRPGIMLYGATPLDSVSADELDLLPAMELSAEIIAIKSLQKGDTVGYGARFKAGRDMAMAVVTMGYGDGYPRASGSAYTLINGAKCPILGAVSMDLMCVELPGLENINVSDTVILWGRDLSVSVVARCLDRFYYQLLTQIGDRVVKRHINL